MVIMIFLVTKLILGAACISVYRNLASCQPILSFSFMWITKLPKLKRLNYWVAAGETSLVVAVATRWQGLEADVSRYLPVSSVLEEFWNSVNVCFGFTGWFILLRMFLSLVFPFAVSNFKNPCGFLVKLTS